MQLRKIFLMTAVCATTNSALQTSSESVNPFNQFMSPSGGVDLFSGKAAFSLPITTLSGRGPSVPIALSYSSNVFINARSRNDVAPTSWVGLGWSLGFSSIICDHKGTTATDDDDYIWISPEGVTQRLMSPHKLKYKYYKYSSISSDTNSAWMPDTNSAIGKYSGQCDYFNTRLYNDTAFYEYVFEGKIRLKYTGVYTFNLTSDDGSTLDIGANAGETPLHIQNGGTHQSKTIYGTFTNASSSDLHTIRVAYFQNRTDYELKICSQIPGATGYVPVSESDLVNPDFALDGGYSPRTLYAERSPHTRFNQQLDPNGICTGWIVTQPDGSKYLYGNLDLGSDRNATRYTLSSGNFVGTVHWGAITQYPCRWDLSEIRDLVGNATKLWYQQELDTLTGTTVGYTKASYPLTVLTTDSARLFFGLQNKVDSSGHPEACDPYDNNFMKQYESKRLQSISVFLKGNKTAAPNNWYNFVYGMLPSVAAGIPDSENRYWEKSLLTGVKEYRNGVDSAHLLNTTQFGYIVDSTDTNFLYGALKSIKNSMGATTNYFYEKRSQPQPVSSRYCASFQNQKCSTVIFFPRLDTIPWPCSYPFNDFSHPLPVYSDDLISGGKGFIMTAGTYDKGKEWIMVQGGGTQLDRLWLYTFDGNKWSLNPQFSGQGYTDSNVLKEVYPIENGFIFCAFRNDTNAKNNCSQGGSGTWHRARPNAIHIVRWRNNKWSNDDFGTYMFGQTIDRIIPGNGFIVTREGYADDNKDRMGIYGYYGDAIVMNGFFTKNTLFSPDTLFPNVCGCQALDINTGNNFIVVKLMSYDESESYHFSRTFRVLQWNGRIWNRLPQPDPLPPNSFYGKCYTGQNYFVFTGGHTISLYCNPQALPESYLFLYYFDGTNLVRDPNIFNSNESSNDRKEIFPGDGFFVYNRWGDATWVESAVHVVTWNGSRWVSTALSQYGGRDDFTARQVFIGPDYFVVFCVKEDSHPYFSIYKKSGTNWNRTILDLESFPVTRHERARIAPGNNAFAFTNWRDPKISQGIATFNGKNWVINWTNSDTTYGWADTNARAICGTAGGFGFYTYNFIQDSMIFNFVHKYNDDYNNIADYTVSSKSVKTRPGALTPFVTYTTSFNYENDHFDCLVGTPKYNKVTTIPPGNTGKIVQYFFNSDSTLDNQKNYISKPDSFSSDFDLGDFSGMPYRSQTLNSAGKEIASSKTYYTGSRFGHWPNRVFDKLTKSSVSTVQGVSTVSEVLSYDTLNGQPVTSRTTNSDGKKKLSQTVYAYKVPQYRDAFFGLDSLYMLTQPCQTFLYEKAANDTGSALTNASVRSSQVTTYSNLRGCNAWMPYKSYAWKSDCGSDGVPTSMFTDFPFTPGSSNPAWKYSDSVALFNRFGQPLQTAKPLTGPNVAVYRNDIGLPIGSIGNAQFRGSGVFTCDYDMNNGGGLYFDIDNGWEKSAAKGSPSLPLAGWCALDTTIRHFGEATIQVINAWGIGRNAELEHGRDYVLSAWVNTNTVPLQKCLIMDLGYSKSSNGPDGWPIVVTARLPNDSIGYLPCTGTIKVVAGSGNWKYVELSVPASTDISSTNWNLGYRYARFWVGAPNGNGSGGDGIVHIDDVRFRPKNSPVTTSYLNSFLQQPILSVDANNNPSHKTAYDLLGRPAATYKFDRFTASQTKLSGRGYYQMGVAP